MRTHLITAAATLALGAGVTAGPAAAADPPWFGKDIAYAITVDGKGTYEYEHTTGSGDYVNTDTANLSFEYHGQISDGVVFRNGSPLDTSGDDIPEGSATGTYTLTGGGSTTTCTVTPGDFSVSGWMRLVDDADLTNVTPLDGTINLWLRPLDQFQVHFDCAGDVSHPSVDLVSRWSESDGFGPNGQLKMGHNPFDFEFALPRDILGMGEIQQLDPSKTLEGTVCPGYLPDEVPTCKLQWTAQVKLVKLWEKAAPTPSPTTTTTTTTTQPGPDDDLLIPLVPTKPPVNDDDDLLIPLVPQGKASLSADASKASFSVSCSAGCSGSASLTAGSGAKVRAAAAKAAKPLARVTFKVAKGQSKRVTLKLGAKARRAVRKAGGARIVVRVTSGSKTTTRTLTVRVPKRGAHR